MNAGSNYLLNVLDSLLTEPYEGVKLFGSIYGQVSKYRGHGTEAMEILKLKDSNSLVK